MTDVARIPQAVPWRNGMVLEPEHFHNSDARAATLAHLAALIGDPWPWGFSRFEADGASLASGQLSISCEGIFPDGTPFIAPQVGVRIGAANDGARKEFHITREEREGETTLQEGDEGPGRAKLPVARLTFQGGVWNQAPDWSPPTFLITPEHPIRSDLNQQLGALAAIGAGFMATLRLPGAEQRPAARTLSQVAAALAQGVGVMEALLAAPAIAPGRIGIEALRVALGVRAAAGVFEPFDSRWDPADQRGSLRRLLYAAESTASGIGLPFRATMFSDADESGILRVGNMPAHGLLLAIEAARPADLISARAWFEGAALAAPDRIQEALTRRVEGCSRRGVERDARIGVSSGPLLALYHVDDDMAWRAGQAELALTARTAPPLNTSFSIFIPEGVTGNTQASADAATSANRWAR